MEAMSPQQETLGGQPGRSSSLTGVSRIAGGPGTKKKMKTLAERRRSAPSLILDKALQKRPSTKESPSASVDTCTFLSSFVCSSRTLLIDGRVELKRGLQRQERHLFLFNDLFVVAKINPWQPTFHSDSMGLTILYTSYMSGYEIPLHLCSDSPIRKPWRYREIKNRLKIEKLKGTSW